MIKIPIRMNPNMCIFSSKYRSHKKRKKKTKKAIISMKHYNVNKKMQVTMIKGDNQYKRTNFHPANQFKLKFIYSLGIIIHRYLRIENTTLYQS